MRYLQSKSLPIQPVSQAIPLAIELGGTYRSTLECSKDSARSEFDKLLHDISQRPFVRHLVEIFLYASKTSNRIRLHIYITVCAILGKENRVNTVNGNLSDYQLLQNRISNRMENWLKEADRGITKTRTIKDE